MDKFVKNVKYEVYEKITGLHKVRGSKVDGKWWNIQQMQYVGGKYTEAGCNWFEKGEIIDILENEGKLIEKGEGKLYEATDDPNLNGMLYVVAADEETGLEHYI